MNKTYSIDKISKLFNIPKSTLRYWESEGLISSVRNTENDYREYDTTSLIQICDIKFYRSLNLPIKKLKSIWKMNINDNQQLLKESKIEIQNNIKILNETLEKIDDSLNHIEKFKKLKKKSYSFSFPKFDKIIYLHLIETENVIEYIKDQSILSFVTNIDNTSIVYYGTIVTDKSNIHNNEHVLWQRNSSIENYLHCLLPIKNNIIDKDTLNSYIEYIYLQNSKPGKIIGQYLVSDSEFDYFQCWIELI